MSTLSLEEIQKTIADYEKHKLDVEAYSNELSNNKSLFLLKVQLSKYSLQLIYPYLLIFVKEKINDNKDIYSALFYDKNNKIFFSIYFEYKNKEEIKSEIQIDEKLKNVNIEQHTIKMAYNCEDVNSLILSLIQKSDFDLLLKNGKENGFEI